MANIITISGTLGSGKSTVARLLAQKMGWNYYSTGMAQRKIAEQRGMTTLELNAAAEQDKTIDAQIDGVFETLINENKNYIVDSRLGFHFIPSSFKVMLTASPEIAGARIFSDKTRNSETTYTKPQEAIDTLLKRRALEVARFKRIYQVDIENLSQFDCVINTDNLTPEQVCAQIESSFKAFQKHQN